MKIGLKTYGEKELIEEFYDKVDFIEIMALDQTDYEFLKNIKTPIIWHAKHEGFKINPADKTKEKENKDSIEISISLANKFNSKKIIVHPGRLKDNNCSKENSIQLIKNIKDKRILIENLVDIKELCTTPKEMEYFMKKTSNGFCLDINHAIEYAIKQNKDYIAFLKEFIKLKPSHYHLGGQKIKERKTHLSLKDSDFDLKPIIALIPKDAEISLETTTDIKRIKEDLIIIKELIN